MVSTKRLKQKRQQVVASNRSNTMEAAGPLPSPFAPSPRVNLNMSRQGLLLNGTWRRMVFLVIAIVSFGEVVVAVSNDNIHESPFLQTKPHGGLPLAFPQKQQHRVNTRQQPALQVKLQKQQIHQASPVQAETQTQTQRMNIRRRRHSESARGKAINREKPNRILKHHQKEQYRTNHYDEQAGTTKPPLIYNGEDYDQGQGAYNETESFIPKHPKVKEHKIEAEKHSLKGTTSKGKSKGNKGYSYEYEYESYATEGEDEYSYGTGKGKGEGSKSKSKSKSKKGHKGVSKGSKGHGLRYFEASILLEMQNHYTSQLAATDLRQLEYLVQETYNYLSRQNCDLQGREFVAVTMEPTPTSTGYILHLQGECYNCDPSYVHVFAHHKDATVFYDYQISNKTEDNDIIDVSGSNSSTTASPSTGTSPPGTNTTGTIPVVAGTVPPAATTSVPLTGNATAAPTESEFIPPANSTGRTSGYESTYGNKKYYLSKKPRTASKQFDRLERSQDQEEGDEFDENFWEKEFYYGTTPDMRAAYNAGNSGRKLNAHHNRNHHSNPHAVNREPEARTYDFHGANVDRAPEPGTRYDQQPVVALEEDRAGHYAEAEADDDDDTPIYPAPERSKMKGYSKVKGSEKSKGKGGKGGYHPYVDCQNYNASHTAPTDEEFVLTLNAASESLLAQYNSLSVRSAVQVRTEPCSSTEEFLESALVIQFMAPAASTSQSLSPEDIEVVEQAILQAYNHLQATTSCDVPYFREMTELVLRGVTQGPDVGTFLAMFSVRGTCRGEGCSSGDSAAFFDAMDHSNARNRNRKLMYINYQGVGFSALSTRGGYDDKPITYNEGTAHVSQEQCYCPFVIEEFGPPFLEDMERVLGLIVQDAYDAGVLQTVVTVLDIMEVTASGEDGDVEYDPLTTEAPTGTESLESFVIVQFFGARDLVTEAEVTAIQESMPLVYRNLQENSYCDPLMRSLSTATLQTVDPGPTDDSFLLGFFWEGTCQGVGCSDAPMFFALPTTNQAFVSCGEGKVEGPPVIDDFENDLFQSILSLRDDGIVINIQSSGDSVEVLPGSTAAPILAGDVRTAPGGVPNDEAPAPTQTTKSAFQGRTASDGHAPAAVPTKAFPTKAPTLYPTWLGTDYPTDHPTYPV